MMAPRSRRPTMLVIGNSHVQMVRSAQAEARIATLRDGDLLVLTRLGAQHNVLGLFEHSRPYRVLDPAMTSHSGGSKAPIPVSALRAEFADLCARDNVMKRLCARRPCRIVHYGAPPPKPQFDKSYKMREIDGQQVRFEFNDPATRLALWKLETEAVSAHVAKMGIEDCPVPPQALDDRGFLAKSFFARDITHANEAYGRLLLECFESLLQPLDTDPACPSREDE